jgi:phospholipase/carboxylesterase
LQLHAVTVPPASGQPAEGLVVILHGWGANAQDVLGLATSVNLPSYQMIFPDAPFPHPYAPAGRMWYDFPSNFSFQSTPGFHDRSDLSTSRQALTDFLKSLPEQTGIPHSRTILGGFSQGGAMTLDVGFNFPLTGLMVLSGYLHAPLQPQLANRPPVLMIHGKQDTVVPLAAAHQARDSLKAAGVNLQYQEFDMGHEIQPIVLAQMQNFAKEVFSKR